MLSSKPETFREYFHRLYDVVTGDCGVLLAERTFRFADSADLFQMIEESGESVIAPYADGPSHVSDVQREGLQQALQESYDVSVAGSADEAFNLMEAQEFEVIVTDLRMPGKSGLKVIDHALAQPNKPAVRRAAATSSRRNGSTPAKARATA